MHKDIPNALHKCEKPVRTTSHPQDSLKEGVKKAIVFGWFLYEC